MAEPATTIGLPTLTRDLDRALEDMREFGVARIEGVLEGTILARVRDALYRAAASDRERGWNTRFIMDNPEDKTNQRVWGLLSRDPIFSDLAEHPTALHFVRALLGWPAMLSNISANITSPGGGEMVLHADQGFAPQPWGGIQGLNVAWAIDEFTRRERGHAHRPRQPPAEPRAHRGRWRAHGRARSAGRLGYRHGRTGLAPHGIQSNRKP
jgi:Phytanoyl-CoA dioxygenase (PhyH)